MPSPSCTVVQLTDTHLFADPQGTLFDVNTTDSLRSVIASVKKSGLNPDFALATGDLVHDETEHGYQRLEAELRALGMPVYALAGNHDAPSFMVDGAVKVLSYPFRAESGSWQFYFLNTHVPGEVHGSLDPGQLDELEKSLSAHPNKFTAICLHHQPVTIGSRWLDRIGLENADALFAAIARYPRVRAVIWGHIHQEWDETRAGVRLLGAPSTCAQFMPKQENFTLDSRPPGWRWLRFFDDGSIDTAVVWIQG